MQVTRSIIFQLQKVNAKIQIQVMNSNISKIPLNSWSRIMSGHLPSPNLSIKIIQI